MYIEFESFLLSHNASDDSKMFTNTRKKKRQWRSVMTQHHYRKAFLSNKSFSDFVSVAGSDIFGEPATILSADRFVVEFFILRRLVFPRLTSKSELGIPFSDHQRTWMKTGTLASRSDDVPRGYKVHKNYYHNVWILFWFEKYIKIIIIMSEYYSGLKCSLCSTSSHLQQIN